MQLHSKTGKRFGILGLGSTGISVIKSLKNLAAILLAWDDRKTANPIDSVVFSSFTQDPAWQNLDYIIVSPGISKSHPIFAFAAQHQICITSDIELFLEELKLQNPNTKLIAITGTNGKTTTTDLITHIAKSNGLDYVAAGNIGVPVLSLAANHQGYVLELSSFQLDLLNSLDIDIAVLLNITPDHLDRYGNFKNYCASKQRILIGDHLKIIGLRSPACVEFYQQLINDGDKQTIAVTVNCPTSNLVNSINVTSQKLHDNYFNYQTYLLAKHINGPHQFENIGASFAAARLIGLKAPEIIQSINSYKTLPHRMELVGKINNISFYNDSKATNTAAALSALLSLENIYWLAGGIFKETTADLEILLSAKKHIRGVYLFGQARQLLADYLQPHLNCYILEDLTQAMQQAYADASCQNADANILLSPACASLDQFKNYAERGQLFGKLFQQLNSKR